MPSFAVKSRITSPIAEAVVDAPSREKALQQTVDALPADGSEIEIMHVEEVRLPAPDAPATT
jgi:hypothetical protein